MFVKSFFVTLLLREILNYQEKANVLGLDDVNNFDLIRVDNETDVIGNDFSFIVSVIESRLTRCTGILLNSSLIVTTATCANSSNEEHTGTVLRTMSLYDGESRNVEKITFHPHYQIHTHNPTALNLYNVAVITLDSPVNEHKTIDLARNITGLVLSQAGCKVISRDISSLNETEVRIFRSYNMTLIDWDECRAEYNYSAIDTNQVCAKTDGSGDVCLIEGAPLICEDQVLGLFSSTSCSTNPVVFMRLDRVEDFLSSQESTLSYDNILSSKVIVNSSSEGTSIGLDDMIMVSTIKPLENTTSTKKVVKVMNILEKSIEGVTSMDQLITIVSLEESQFDASKSQNISNRSEEVGLLPSNISVSLSNETITSNSSLEQVSEDDLLSMDKIRRIQGYKKLFSGHESGMGCAKSGTLTARSPLPSLTIVFVYSLTIGLIGISIGSYSSIINV